MSEDRQSVVFREAQETPQDSDDNVIGPRIRAIREVRGQSIEEIAKATGFPVDVLEAFEEGAKDPSLNELSTIAAALEVPMPQLFGELSPVALVVASLFERIPPNLQNAVKSLLRLQRGNA